MHDRLTDTIEILERLVGFPSLSGRPNHEIVGYIRETLEAYGLDVILSHDEDGQRFNVFATIGPKVDGGVILSGHTDVVPVEGQKWASDPFRLTRRGDRLYGRGSVDMKGFLACAMASVPVFQAAGLKRPIHIAFTYDEETGGFGMPVLLKNMQALPYRPSIVIVGEPTEMNIVTGHKGGIELRTEITGHEVHSSVPSRGVNAISVAIRLMRKIEEIGDRLASTPEANSPFDPPYATFNFGTIDGGPVRNATAGWCHFDWEMRPMPGQDWRSVLSEIEAFAASVLLPEMKAVNPNADIRIITEVAVPSLDNRNAAVAAGFVRDITGQNSEDVVSFGTDGGYFSDEGYSTVVFGPGTIKRAHGTDEFIEIAELKQGLDFLGAVAAKLSA